MLETKTQTKEQDLVSIPLVNGQKNKSEICIGPRSSLRLLVKLTVGVPN